MILDGNQCGDWSMFKKRRMESVKKFRWKYWLGVNMSGGVFAWATKANDW